MATALTLDHGLDFGRVLPGEEPRPARGPDSDRRDRPTLDDLVVAVWEGLRASQPATCPICGGTMLPRHGSGPRPVGECCDCRTVLA